MFIIPKITAFLICLNLVNALSKTSLTASDIHVLIQSKEYGHPAVVYDVITEDGYIMNLFHIPGNKRYPVLLMHGASDTADTWLVRGNTSLGITLANSGYDVWLGNCRGNKYGRRHQYLDPDKDTDFWNFTLHEHGFYDLPAIIDTVLKLTGATKLNAIGHSQGNTIYYVLGSTRPEYNAKVNILIALAPVCYLHNTEPPLSTLFSVMPSIYKITKELNIHEIFGSTKFPGNLLKIVCSIPYLGYSLCVENFLYSISGADPEEFGPEIFEKVNQFFPSSTSVKNLNHFGQLHNRRAFAQYDYGVAANRIKYNSSEPPQYDLAKVTLPVALIVGLNDKISEVKDIEILRRRLGNVVNYSVSPRKSFNHMDDTWGKNMNEYLFPFIFGLLEKYN